jgi:ketosteroid isomerase-like protein
MSVTATGTGLSPADVSAIRGIREPWIKACVTRNWDALLGLCTDDVVFQPPNEAVVQGNRVRPWLEGFPTIKAMDWDIEHTEGNGDLAWLRGWVNMTLDVSGQQIRFNGKYTDVCRKQSGSWRIALVMWSSNDPA